MAKNWALETDFIVTEKKNYLSIAIIMVMGVFFNAIKKIEFSSLKTG